MSQNLCVLYSTIDKFLEAPPFLFSKWLTLKPSLEMQPKAPN